MRVLIIGALAVIALSVFIGVLIYDRKVLAKRKLILHALWKKASHLNDNPVGIPVRKIAIMEDCDVDAIKFAALITKLSNDGIIKREQDTIELTNYGKQYYEFKVKNDHPSY